MQCMGGLWLCSVLLCYFHLVSVPFGGLFYCFDNIRFCIAGYVGVCKHASVLSYLQFAVFWFAILQQLCERHLAELPYISIGDEYIIPSLCWSCRQSLSRAELKPSKNKSSKLFSLSYHTTVLKSKHPTHIASGVLGVIPYLSLIV